MISHRKPFARRNQRGAALIIGLLLLVIVTVLAISAVGTANTELVMSGNEQFRERATQAADAGIETVMMSLRKDVEPFPGNYDEKLNVALGAASLAGDKFSTRTDYLGESTINNYGSMFTLFMFRTVSTGESKQNSRAVHEAGAWTPGPKQPGNPGNCGPPRCTSGVL